MVVTKLIHSRSHDRVAPEQLGELEVLIVTSRRVDRHPTENLLYCSTPLPSRTRVLIDRNRRNVVTLVDEVYNLLRLLHCSLNLQRHGAGNAEGDAHDGNLRVERLHHQVTTVRRSASQRVACHQNATRGVLQREATQHHVHAVVEPFVNAPGTERLRHRFQVHHHVHRDPGSSHAKHLQRTDGAHHELLVGLHVIHHERGTLRTKVGDGVLLSNILARRKGYVILLEGILHLQ